MLPRPDPTSRVREEFTVGPEQRLCTAVASPSTGQATREYTADEEDGSPTSPSAGQSPEGRSN